MAMFCIFLALPPSTSAPISTPKSKKLGYTWGGRLLEIHVLISALTLISSLDYF
jgi:hypothetical protein